MKLKKTEIELAIMVAEALEKRLADLGLYIAGTASEIADQLRLIEAQRKVWANEQK